MDFEQKLKEIASLREQKGKEEETLSLIAQIEHHAAESNAFDVLVKLNWERSLVFQHMAMNEESKPDPDQNIIGLAINKMETATLEADKVIASENLNSLKPMSCRFLAQLYRYKKQYDRAASAYTAAISEYEKTNAVNSLELKGFLASVLVLQGKTQEGIDLAIKTFNAFETDLKALKMKKEDYATWAIWKSGIIPRLIRALDETKAVYDKPLILDYLQKSQSILDNPQGPVTWGDSAFTFRQDEILKAKSLLALVLAFFISVISATIKLAKPH